MESCVFDIETTDLAAVGAGIILCACVRPIRTGRTRTIRIDQYKYEPSDEFGTLERQETDLVRDLLEELSKYQLLIGHNVIRFDLPYIKSRAIRRGVPFGLYPFMYDTMQAMRRIGLRTVLNMMGKPSARLDMAADFFGIPQEKTALYPREHWETVWGNNVERTAAMDKLVDHCQRDVRMNWQVYEAALPLDMKATFKRAL